MSVPKTPVGETKESVTPLPRPRPPKAESFLHSLRFALSGLRCVLQTERNFRIHIVMAILVGVAGLFFHVRLTEWVLLVLCMAVMMTVEALNTAVEAMADILSDEKYCEKTRRVKDIAAGACLLTAMGVAIAGLMIFWPYFSAILQH